MIESEHKNKIKNLKLEIHIETRKRTKMLLKQVKGLMFDLKLR
jgi:hypothetical protein